jgi:hypothetical protein
MARSLLGPNVSPIGRTSLERMDEMDPQMSSVLAGRVALERLAPVDHEQDEPSRRQIGSIIRLAQRSVALVAGLTSARRSPASAAGSVSSK